MKKIDKTLCSQAFYAKMKGISRATVVTHIDQDKVDCVEVLGELRLIKLSPLDSEEVSARTPERINSLKLVQKPRKESIKQRLSKMSTPELKEIYVRITGHDMLRGSKDEQVNVLTSLINSNKYWNSIINSKNGTDQQSRD